MRRCFLVFVCLSLFAAPVFAQSDSAEYVPDPKYYLWEFMSDIRDSVDAIRDSITAEIRGAQKKLEDLEDSTEMELQFGLEGLERPSSPDEFESVFYFEGANQHSTGTCWCFSTTSFMESEVARITGREIRLSEMFTVYNEYIEKCRNYVRTRGWDNISQGSESNAVVRMMKMYGAMPHSVYDGLVGADSLHDHWPMTHEIREYLEVVKENDYWDEEYVLDHVRLIMDKYIGTPPAEFEFEGKTYTPIEFRDEVLKLDLDAYVEFQSTMSELFYRQTYFDAPDNWWYDSTYYNLPLSDWYAALEGAVTNGYSATIGGDVSGPGWFGPEDIALIPDFDIPRSHINQSARELRIYNETTTDDHGVHLVGYKLIGDDMWFLIKDSSSGARLGKQWGYMFMREDYAKLKMLTFMVHRDAVEDILEKCE